MSSTLDLRQGRYLRPKREPKAPSRWRQIRATRKLQTPTVTRINPATKLEQVVEYEERRYTKREAKLAAYPERMFHHNKQRRAKRRHGRRTT